MSKVGNVGYTTKNTTQLYLTEKEEMDAKKPPMAKRQGKKERDVVRRMNYRFDNMRTNRDRSFSYFRERNIYEYQSDNEERFNNYRRKPDWKESWQANISDITTHSKIMALVAIVVANKMKTVYTPRLSHNVMSEFKAGVFQSIKDYIETSEINQKIYDVFTVLLGLRDGTAQAFKGYKKSPYYEGIDMRFIPINEGFPGDISEFRIEDQPRYIWQTTMEYSKFKNAHKGSQWIDVKKVMPAGQIYDKYSTFFNIQQDLQYDQVEKRIIWDRENNEFAVTANGIIITKYGAKLTDVQKDREIPVLKTVTEPFDINFYYGRSIPDLMKDNQDAIDFLFNSMFDRTLLSTMRPILVGGVNDLADDYWSPGIMKQVQDVTQVKELGFESIDLNSFRILKELQDRNVFVSVDPSQQGVAMGSRTATEVERANQAQRLKTALLNDFFSDWQLRDSKLTVRIIKDNYIKNNKFKPFLVESTKLTNGEIGNREIEITNKIPQKNGLGFSKELAVENMMIPGESEIIKISEKELKSFELDVKIDLDTPANLPIQKATIRDYVNSRLPIALQQPSLLNADALLEEEARVTPGIDWNKVKGEQAPPPQQGPGQMNIPALQQAQGTPVTSPLPNTPE